VYQHLEAADANMEWVKDRLKQHASTPGVHKLCYYEPPVKRKGIAQVRERGQLPDGRRNGTSEALKAELPACMWGRAAWRWQKSSAGRGVVGRAAAETGSALRLGG